MSSEAILSRKAADSSIMDKLGCIAPWFSKMQGQKSLTLCWHSFLGHSSDVVATIVALQGGDSWIMSQCRRTALSIVHDAMPQIVDAPSMLLFRMWQCACHLHFRLQCRPTHSLWKDVTMQPMYCQMCKTKNCWCSVDAHIHHSETAFWHSIIVCNESYPHYWLPISGL